MAVIGLILFFCVTLCCALEKPYRLKMLVFVNDGAEATYYQLPAYTASLVNNRSNLLPDYQIDIQLAHEGLGELAAAKTIQFITQDAKRQSDYFLSPLMVGPQISTACKAVSPALEYINMVAISHTCAAPVLANHVRYHNFYLMIQTSQFTGLVELRLMRELGWKRFALFTYAANPNDYESALMMNKVAIDNGFSVLWFSMLVDVDLETVQSLKETDARIIVVFTSSNAILYKFLCLSYNVGITGQRYVFLANFAATVDPSGITDKSFPGCTRAMILEQIKQTIFSGPAMNYLDSTLRSVFGQSQTDFDSSLQAYANSSRPPFTSFRFVLHDSITKAVYALHDAEEQLKRENLSLRDYSLFPNRVMKVVNDSVTKVVLPGLHIRRMSYNKAGMPEGEAQIINQWSAEEGTQTVALGYQLNGTGFDLDGYSIQSIRKIKWITANGGPPRDFQASQRSVRVVPNGVSIAVIVLATILAVCQIGVVVVSPCISMLRQDTPICQILGSFGCVLVDVSAICFVFSGKESAEEHSRWLSAIILLVTGLSFTNSVLTLRAGVLRWKCPKISSSRNTPSRNHRTVKSSVRFSNRPIVISPAPPVIIDWKYFDKVMSLGALLFSLLNGAILIAWFISEPLVCTIESLGDPVYLNEKDLLVETLINRCTSSNMNAWSLGITFLHVAILGNGGWLAYAAKKHLRNFPGYTCILFGLANSAAVILCILLVLVVVEDSIGQQIVIAFGALLYSALTSSIWAWFNIKTAEMNL